MSSFKDLYVVGIGASVGGLEAIKQLFSNLPENMGMAFVIVQHLLPDHKSLMPGLLAKYTSMKIYTAEKNLTIQPNSIYLNLSDKNLKISGGKFVITKIDPKKALHLPIDFFFQSLGEEFKEKAVGIILSGTGSDGLRGLRTIKELGGTIIAQEPNSAQFDGMPNAAISTNLVDFILKPNQMAEALSEISKYNLGFKDNENSKDETDNNEELFLKILNELHRSTGIDFKDYKRNTLVRRLEKRLQITGIGKLKDYLNYLKNNPEEREILLQDFLIGVTCFFRDIEAFSILQKKVIPKICQKKPENELIRIWVPGCSTGEEVFTIAMLFDEYIKQQNLHTDFKIFATDADAKAITKASRAIYPVNIVEELDEEYLKKYFIHHGDKLEIAKQLREKIVFSIHNILKDPPFIRMDLISCRNLLIYLDNRIQKKVLLNFQFALNKFGFLYLGNSESIGDIRKYFEQIDSKWKIYQNISDHKPLTSQHSLYHKISNTIHPMPAKRNEPADYKEKENPESVFHRFLSNRYSPSCIFIDKNYNIVFIRGDAGKRLLHSEGLFERNLLKIVNTEMAAVIRNGIHRLDMEKKEVVYKDIIYTIDNTRYTYDISFYHPESPELSEMCVIEFSDDHLIDESSKLIVNNITIDDFSKQRIAFLEDELKSVKTELQNVIEELETSNEELQSSNEELMSSNEELQGTNEELQSANEELYTVNAEFQEKNKELNDLNNDINNLLNSTDIGTLFLDNELVIRKFTPALRRHFKLQESDLGRPIASFASNFNEEIRASIITDSRKVLNELVTIEKEIIDSDNNCYLKRISPFITSEKKIEGVVITFIDISKLKQTESQLTITETKYKNLFDNLNEGFLHGRIMMNEKGEPVDWKFIDVNHAFAKHIGREVGEIVGRLASELFPESTPQTTGIYKLYGHSAITGEEQFIQNYRDPSGKYFILHIFCPLKGEFAATFTEITEAKKTEEKLKESEQKFRKIFENSPFGMVMTNSSFKFTAVNNTFCDMLGYCGEEIMNLTFKDITHKEDIKRDLDGIKRLMTREIPVYKSEKRYIRKDGGIIWASLTVNANFGDDGEFKYNLATIENITFRKEFELELKSITERLDLATSSSNIGIWDWNIESNKLVCDKQMYVLYGIDSKNPVEDYEFWLSKIHPEDQKRSLHEWRQALSGESDYDTAFRVVWPDSSVHWIKASGKVINNDKNKPLRMIGVNLDITSQKNNELLIKKNTEKIESQNQEYLQLNEELTQINKELIVAKEKAEESDRFKTAFLQNVSHEIRTPLNAIMGFSDLLTKNFNDKTKLEKFSSIIIRRGTDLLDIINDIIDVSKIESGQTQVNIEECNLNELLCEISNVVSGYQLNIGKQHISLNIEIKTEQNLTIKVDKAKLKQIFINLLTNAIKYTHSGNIHFGFDIENEQLIFHVTDTGIGIPFDKQAVIFDRFVRLDNGHNGDIGGTGLGLSIVKGLVNLLGGKIWVDSIPEKGSTFYFTVSYILSASSRHIPKIKKEQIQLIPTKKKILIIEDDPWNSEYLNELLSIVTDNLLMAETGKRAIEIVKEHAVDLVLMDIRLPDISGYEAIKEIRKINPGLRIIAQTAYASIDEKTRAIQAGCIDYISKPIKQDELFEMLNTHLKSQ